MHNLFIVSIPKNFLTQKKIFVFAFCVLFKFHPYSNVYKFNQEPEYASKSSTASASYFPGQLEIIFSSSYLTLSFFSHLHFLSLHYFVLIVHATLQYGTTCNSAVWDHMQLCSVGPHATLQCGTTCNSAVWDHMQLCSMGPHATLQHGTTCNSAVWDHMQL